MSFLTKALTSFSNPYTAAAQIGGSVLGGILGNRESARTQKTDQTTSNASTTRTRRVLRPEQEPMLGALATRASDLLTNPTAVLDPIRSARRNAVNQDYAGIEDTLADRMLSHGGRNSGKFGRAVRETNVARVGALADVDSDMARLVLEQQDRGSSLMERLLGMTFDNEIGTSSTGSMSGTNVLPGSMMAGGVNSGLETLSALQMINKLLQG